MIHLEKITKDNHRKFIRLKVKSEQNKFVADNSNILARAYAYIDEAKVYCIYNDDEPVGLALVRASVDFDAYIFDQMMIGKKFQGIGYGKTAIKLILDELKKEKKFDKVLLCYVEGDNIARDLYASLGFKHNGIVDECEGEPTEIDMELVL